MWEKTLFASALCFALWQCDDQARTADDDRSSDSEVTDGSVSFPDIGIDSEVGPAIPLPTELPACPLSFEECLGPHPGCYFDECEGLAECPITGCDTNPPELSYVIHGADLCEDAWVVLGDATGRLEARDVVRALPWGLVTFTAYLDGVARSTCRIEGLPTGAVRYQMTCDDMTGVPVHASVLEISSSCPECPDLSGCYDIEAPPLICDPFSCPEVEVLRIRSTGGCGFQIDIDQLSTPLLAGWISHDGILTFGYAFTGGGGIRGGTALTCSLSPTDDGFGPAICRLFSDGEETTLSYDTSISLRTEPDCPLPECVRARTCEIAGLGEECVDGMCR